MKTSTMVYAALFCVAMIASYLTWTKAPEEVNEEGGIVLIDAEPEEISKIEYTSEKVDATFEQKKDELGQYLWVSTTRRVEQKTPKNPHDPHAGHDHGDEEPEPEPEKGSEVKVETSTFKAGKAGEQLLDELAPFRVSRELEVTKEQLADFGLDEPKSSLTVTTESGTTKKYDIGATAYGHKHVYLRDSEGGDVYVIKRSIVSPLERADSRLPEKELFEGPTTDITAAHISTPSGSLQLVQRNREDASKATWTAPDSDSTNTTADAWLDKVFRLRSQEYVSGKPQGELVFAVKLEFVDRDQPTKIEVFRSADDKGEELWLAKSDYTRGFVRLNPPIASDVAADVATLFAAE